MSQKNALIFPILALSLTLTAAVTAQQSTGLAVEPGTFDFGWAPADAKVSARFQVKNLSASPIPILDVEPSCGCTAPEFTPASLSSNAAMPIGLTFNTRGYEGRRFYKKSKIKAEDIGDEELWVNLRGHVTDPNAALRPTGSGIAAFGSSRRPQTQTIQLKNDMAESLALSVVQPADSWAQVSLPASIPAGGSADVSVQIEGGINESRFTSVTLEGRGGEKSHRVTLAIRAGDAAGDRPRIRPPAASGVQ